MKLLRIVVVWLLVGGNIVLGEGAWITTKSEWDDLSVNLSIQTDFGFATYLFEKQLY